jgi:preprotein translocase subunit SecE
MARDRQRAKQRKARRAAQNPGPAPSEPHRANVPGELEHSSGDQDEFDAALVAGADGEPVDEDDDAAEDLTAGAALDADDEVTDGTDRAALDDDRDEAYAEDGAVYDDELDEEDGEPFDGDEPFDDDEDDDRGGAVAMRGPDRPAARERRRRGARPTAAAPAGAATRGGPGRLLAFLQASWAELQRVQWPDRRQVFQATAVVLGFVVVAGLYLGLADRVAQEVVDLII